jgi:threonine 3-dehydrogenase
MIERKEGIFMTDKKRETILITGANGEVGQGLIRRLDEWQGEAHVIVVDLKPLPEALANMVDESIVGNILDNALLADLAERYTFDTIYHLAALLSTTGEHKPLLAHAVNVQGTMNMIQMALAMGEKRGAPVKFIYPSSIAIYGIDTLKTKMSAGPVHEDDFLTPTTMYGCNKLYTESIGHYYANHYQQLSGTPQMGIDFRSVRFPGLISAFTVPSGGTSDYGPEMLHAAAQGKPYACFVREDTTIPFMTMRDGVKALIDLANADRGRLTRDIYNIGAFSLSAGEFAEMVRRYFPDANITFAPDKGRQAIVDTWCADVDDYHARADWDWQADYDTERAFSEYLVPNIKARYGVKA